MKLGLLPLLIIAASIPAAAQVPAESVPITVFSIRADLSQADAIAPLLAKIGESVLYPIQPGQDAQFAVAYACGAPPPPLLGLETLPSKMGTSQYARAAPCVRRLHNVIVIARDGDTLETIAVRLGMRPSSSHLLRVRKGKSPLRRQMKAGLSKGDQVVAALAPDWTTVTPRPGTVRTREEFVKAIALAMKCGAENDDSCLMRRSVFVTVRTPRKPAGNILQSRVNGEENQPEPPSGPPFTPAPAPAPSAVAEGQWPYDAELVKLLLKEAVDAGGLRPTLIGVADNGLGSRDGAPLAPDLFAATYEVPPSNDNDDDDNTIIDDLIGAGAARLDNGEGRTGDVALCGDQPAPDYASWSAEGRESASHGSVVASIATGHPLRSNQIAAALPRLLFYRTVRNGCTADAGLQISEKDVVDAAEYLLFYDVKVVNMSFAEEPGNSATLASQLSHILVAPNAPILVAAAGNYTGNLDERFFCPACLGNSERYPTVPRQRVIVVGAADRALRRHDYSGFGRKTVRLYAPGEPVGALDIAGQDASAFKSATSYATPLASLAVGLAYALGMDDQAKIRNRLYLSTWPLLEDDGQPVGRLDGPLDIGVLDLVRVAAIRFHAIETLRDGVRRVYVGRIVAGIEGVCPGTAVDQPAFQAIRLGRADANGLRDSTLVKRAADPRTYFPLSVPASCASTGTVTIEALRDGRVDVPAASITQILMPSKPR